MPIRLTLLSRIGGQLAQPADRRESVVIDEALVSFQQHQIFVDQGALTQPAQSTPATILPTLTELPSFPARVSPRRGCDWCPNWAPSQP
jgi:hypothetical protein